MGANISLIGMASAEAMLNTLSDIRMEAVKKATLRSIYQRAKSPGGTPVDTGELRMSAGITGLEFGYTKDYAPHVEYGHRTRSGGYVAGQHFLQRNVETEAPLYRKRVLDNINKLVKVK